MVYDVFAVLVGEERTQGKHVGVPISHMGRITGKTSLPFLPAPLNTNAKPPSTTDQALWLFFAYRLEFLGASVFRELFVAGWLHFVANVVVIVVLLRGHQYTPVLQGKRG